MNPDDAGNEELHSADLNFAGDPVFAGLIDFGGRELLPIFLAHEPPDDAAKTVQVGPFKYLLHARTEGLADPLLVIQTDRPKFVRATGLGEFECSGLRADVFQLQGLHDLKAMREQDLAGWVLLRLAVIVATWIPMRSGRELDALVAEKVLGWTAQKRENLRGYNCLCGSRESCEKCGGPLPYSAEIAAAWDVLNSGRFSSWAMRWDHEERKHYVQLELGGDRFIAYAETAPRAISLAALKAVGVQV